MARIETWALVTNGVQARILRGLENGGAQAPIDIVSKADSTHLRDIMSDRSGRSFKSGDTGRRSGMELGSDPVRRDMQDFAQETICVRGVSTGWRSLPLQRCSVSSAKRCPPPCLPPWCLKKMPISSIFRTMTFWMLCARQFERSHWNEPPTAKIPFCRSSATSVPPGPDPWVSALHAARLGTLPCCAQ
jgi:hypothetical protein